ncbi:YciI family protein [Falsiroseomonas oryziterrae]|uniref:YciI family protein n=1 Tax=Falsiroseomonas oryziterrae TaxID=2911368 RepID=UPI001F30A98C|nr:YciI family protein [Roseomonas sp. NPKOSM-4]
MAFVILAFDGDDADAPARRMAARDAHVAVITEEATAGRLALGLPLHDEAARSLGSLMVLDVPDRAGVDAYLAREPFAREVWRRVEVLPFRIAPLPYAPWPTPGSAMPGPRSHTVLIARDGADPDAPARRMAARQAHFDRVRPFAADGTLLFGGAILDAPEGRMVGSIAVTRHADHGAAQRFWAADPYVTGGVWRDTTFYGSLLRPLPYKPLPG